MAPRKRTTKDEPKTELTEKQQQQAKVAALLEDFDKKCQMKRAEIERNAQSMVKAANMAYVREFLKIGMTTRALKLTEYLASRSQLKAELKQIVGEVEAIPVPIQPITKKARTAAKAVPTPALAKSASTPALIPASQPANIIPTPMPGTLRPPLPMAIPALTAIKVAQTPMLVTTAPTAALVPRTRTAVKVAPRPQRSCTLTVSDPMSKENKLIMTDSPLPNDAAQCPQLETPDLNAIKNLQSKLAKMVEINEVRRGNENDQPGPSASSKR